ncbi:MAG: hypothetical protein AMXMBFR53_12370 [Gemmatimonadota bacterium]
MQRATTSRRTALLAVGLALLARLPADGQAPVRLTGRVVTAAGSPIPGALIALDAGASTLADSAGAFVLEGIRPGPYRVAAVAPGCHVGLGEISVPGGGLGSLSLEVPVPRELEDRLSSWNLGPRSEGGAVRSMSGDAIRRRHFRSVQDILRVLAPDMVGGQSASVGERQSLRSRGAPTVGASGDPLIIVDGVRLGQRPMDALSGLNTEEIERVEVVRGGTGGWRYGTQGANGVVVVTTRDARGAWGEETPPGACGFTFPR